ncbi:MAG TPA: hypothetical protein VIF62_24585 [Labilithrix sp.]|jgi:hypothetical protein
MNSGIQRERLLDSLLNTLEAERYVRGPLLLEVLDQLDASAPAAAFARRMLQGLEAGRLKDADFNGELAELRQLVRTSSSAAA